MKTTDLKTYSLFLVIVLWGTLLGGIVYSHVVFFPVYLSALPDSAVLVNGPYGLSEERFWLMIHPLLILSLIGALTLNWKSKPRRKFIQISFAVYVLVLVITSIYFIPELMAFQRSPGSGVSPVEWLARGQRWQRLSWVRGTAMYISILPLLMALNTPSGISDEPRK